VRKFSIEDCHASAKLKGGKCLSKEYVNFSTKILWECKEGHKWEAAYKQIKRGNWCRKCYDLSRKCSIEDCQVLAKSKGGKCLSKEYVNAGTKMLWECNKESHMWEASYAHIKRGNWCPRCAFKKNARRHRK